MADITSGRARRMLSVGRLTTAVGGSYLWQALKRPFQSASRADRALLEAHIRNAERVVGSSKELRGAFMKLAQILSMRQDLFPTEALEVLSVVQSAVPPMPWAQVRAVVAAELGAPPEVRFRRFEPEAFAAASLGQVHRAETKSGEPVAVKVQYPGIAKTVRDDVKNVRALLRILTAIARDILRQDFDREEVAAELEARLAEELDYRQEARNLARFRGLLADDPEVEIPRVHPKLSTARVLTMSLLEGYPIQEIMAPGVDEDLKDWVGVKLYRLFWRQVLEFGVLHTDPHPGNYLVTHHPHVGILDFGAVRVFEPEIRRGYLDLARGLLDHDDARIADACRQLGALGPGDDADALVRIVHIGCEPLERDEVFDPKDFDLVERTTRVTQLAMQHRLFRAPGHQVFLGRALLGVDAYLRALARPRNWHRLFRDIVEAAATSGAPRRQ
ncbi:MAG TPA: AarF/ABC1/UbiB kinase family protein [Candidatus Binatia bacterium]|jgi:predicted unusual protein kinase regulating ubiquinone biosynthesis (AarF/ABC1/UbiB family)|nr:AarF/ABC1/UbiB kinase family protein [Candidatus Binatia bacterium]